MNRLVIFIFILSMSMAPTPALASETQDNAVLISASETQVPEFTSKELRLLFLGYPVTKSNITYEPVINFSNQLTYDKFLQKIMYMTESRYNRQLLSRVFQHGGVQPRRIDNLRDLISHLRNKPTALTFVVSNATSQFDDIQVVQRLW